jgi:4-hydroxythreonine-4-phosphate dehydrogenase
MTHAHTRQEKPRVGITLGDFNGVGPEVALKALADHRILSLVTPVIYGSTRVLSFYKKSLELEEFNYNPVRARGQFAPKNVNVVNCWEDNIEIVPGKASKEAGKCALLAIQQACADAKEGLIQALVTAPIDKSTIHSDEFPFRGHTEFLASYFGSKDTAMCMVSERLRVALVTDHLPLNQVSAAITKELLNSKINTVEKALQKDFGIQKPRLALLALNPHAGDGGLLGKEDDEIIRPVIIDLKNKGKLLYGPFPADGFFGTGMFSRYDAILAMYHDQGLGPFKTLAFESGVNYTAGLPVVRTSPDHGTAYPIAGKNQANEQSMREAIYLAVDILKHKLEPSKENLS